MACLRAPNHGVNENILSASLRDLAAEVRWVTPMSVSRVRCPAKHTVLKPIASSFVRVVVPVKPKRSNDS